MDKIIIGLTGPIGAGKSAAARMMWDRGYNVIIADAVGHQILARPEITSEMRAVFGDEIFDDSGEVIRAPLAAIVFADETTTKRFNQIVHPPLLAELEKRCEDELEDVILEAALLFEWGDEVEYDISVCVYAPEKLRRARTTNLYSADDFSGRQETQLPPIRKMEMADIVVMNDGNIVELGEKIDRLIGYLDAFKASGELPTELTL